VKNCGFSGWINYRLAGDNVRIYKKKGDKLSVIK
jgi:hypothetical protein